MAALILPAILVPGATLVAAIICFAIATGGLAEGPWQGHPGATHVVIASEVLTADLGPDWANVEVEATGSVGRVRPQAGLPADEVDGAPPLRGTLDRLSQTGMSAGADQGDDGED